MLRLLRNMKKSLLFGMMLLAASSMFAEEQVVTVGSTTGEYGGYGANNFPMWSYYECSESEFVYTAEDLASLPAGEIKKMEYAVYGGSWLYTGFKIWLENIDEPTIGGETGLEFRSTDDMTSVYADESKTSSKFEGGFEGADLNNPAYMGFNFAQPFVYTGGGLRVHFTSESFYYASSDFLFVQDLTKIFEDENNTQNCILRSGGGNWSREQIKDPGRMFPVVKFTVDASATGVEGPAVKEVKNVTYYNVYGQKVDADAKGLVISSDGKKFFRN